MRKDTKYINIAMFDGKMPPHDYELEQVALGSIIMDSSSIVEVSNLFTYDIFYHPVHIEIAKAILELVGENAKIDILTVNAKLRQLKKLEFVGGSHYVAKLSNRVGSTVHIKSHVCKLHEYSIKRKLIVIGHEMLSNGYDQAKDPFDALENAEMGLKSISAFLSTAENEVHSFSDLIKQEYDDFDRFKANGISTIQTGIKPIDDELVFGDGNLILIAGRPGMGKSVLGMSIAKGAAKLNYKMAFFSLEMNRMEFMGRIIADEISYDGKKIADRDYDDETRARINGALGRLNNIPLFIDDKATNTIKQMWSKCLKLKSTVGLDGVVIDYIGLIPTPELPPQTNPTNQLEYLTRNLKLMAKDLGVPVFGLAQLSREVEREDMKKPKMHHLRGSGSLEQDADQILFCWRPAEYEIEADEEGKPYPNGYMEIIVGKRRNGRKGALKVKFHPQYQRITDPNENQNTFYKPLNPNYQFEQKVNEDITPNPNEDAPF